MKKIFPKKFIINYKFLVFIVIIALLILGLSLKKEKKTLLTTGFVGTSERAVLRLSPPSGSYQIGETFQVNILLDTQDYQVSGVDIHYLNYPSNLLEIQDAQPEIPEIQIAPGNLFANTPTNQVDPNLGRIDFSQVSVGGSTFQGIGRLATITFKVLAQGTAQVEFDFTPGETRDTNVAANGDDVLSGVENGEYSLVPSQEKKLRLIIRPEGRTDFSSLSLKIAVLYPGTENIAFQESKVTDSAGEVVIDLTQFTQNTWDIKVVLPYYLPKKKTNIRIGAPETVVEVRDILAGNLYDQDNMINSFDWSIMNLQWGRTDFPPADINQDGIVNSIDWSFMNKNWWLTEE